MLERGCECGKSVQETRCMYVAVDTF
jgi:hypothetical protein